MLAGEAAARDRDRICLSVSLSNAGFPPFLGPLPLWSSYCGILSFESPWQCLIAALCLSLSLTFLSLVMSVYSSISLSRPLSLSLCLCPFLSLFGCFFAVAVDCSLA